MSTWNPYREWLGIDRTKPDYFELLGIPRDTSDPTIIKQAATQRLQLLAKHTGQLNANQTARIELGQRLVQQVKQAYATLRDPQTRQDYLDRIAAPVKPASRTGAVGATLPTPSETASSEIRVSAKPKRRRAAGSSWGVWVTIIGLFVVGPLILIGVLYALGYWGLPSDLAGPRQAEPVQANQSAATQNGQGAAPGGKPIDPEDNEGNQQPTTPVAENSTVENPPETISSNPTPPPPPVDTHSAEQTDNDQPRLTESEQLSLAQVTRALAVIKSALRHRNYDLATVASKHLDFTSNLFSEANLGPLTDNDGRHWISAVRDFQATASSLCEKLAPGFEFEFRGETCAVIEGLGDRILLRYRGQPELYLYEDLPAVVQIQLAESKGIPDIPTWRLHKTAYQLLLADLVQDGEIEGILGDIQDSAADGHDVDAWNRLVFLRDTLSNYPVALTAGAPQLDNNAVTNEVLKQLGVDDPRQIDTEMALALHLQLLGDAIEDSDRDARAKRLMVAWQLALTGGTFSGADQALSLLATDYALDRENALIESYQVIHAQPLSASEQELSTLKMISIAESLVAQQRISPKLTAALNKARDLATKLDRPSLRNRIERILKETK